MPARPERRTLKLACYGVFISVIVAELITLAWCKNRCVRLGYEILKAKSAGDEIKRSKSSLDAEIVFLKSPNRILAIGQGRMGLVVPTLSQVVVVPDGTK